MAAMATLIRIRLCFIYITVFRWRVAPCARIDINADVTANGIPLPKVFTNMRIRYKGCGSVFVTVFADTEEGADHHTKTND